MRVQVIQDHVNLPVQMVFDDLIHRVQEFHASSPPVVSRHLTWSGHVSGAVRGGGSWLGRGCRSRPDVAAQAYPAQLTLFDHPASSDLARDDIQRGE